MVPTMTASVGRLGGLGLDLVADTGVLQISQVSDLKRPNSTIRGRYTSDTEIVRDEAVGFPAIAV